MTTLGKTAWNKGKKFPHSNEWEEKRINAVKMSAKNRVYPKGYKRPIKHIKPMLDALKSKMEKNPEKYKQIAISNLPKNSTGENNGNWKGGITEQTRGIRASVEYKKWRLKILERDGHRCKMCDSLDNLQVHHIVPISQLESAVFMEMNGVTLCKKCHYENDEAWKGERYESPVGRFSAIFKTIPHKLQVYNTCGNWSLTSDGVIVIFVSETGNEDYNSLIAVHELIEALFCRKNGIKEEDVTRFDLHFEGMREDYPDLVGDMEPGDHDNAPYNKEHKIASMMEKWVADNMKVDYEEYNKTVNDL